MPGHNGSLKKVPLIGILVLLIGFGGITREANAQARPEQSDPCNSLEVEGVGTLTNGSLASDVVDRRLFLLGLSYRLALARKSHVTVRFTTEAIPLAVLREPFFAT